jgi:hypothetical protein
MRCEEINVNGTEWVPEEVSTEPGAGRINFDGPCTMCAEGARRCACEEEEPRAERTQRDYCEA